MSPWTDITIAQPADGTTVWVRLVYFGEAVLATWRQSAQVFDVAGSSAAGSQPPYGLCGLYYGADLTTLQLPWYMVGRWKPM
jgi:hypothetical protein